MKISEQDARDWLWGILSLLGVLFGLVWLVSFMSWLAWIFVAGPWNWLVGGLSLPVMLVVALRWGERKHA